VVQCLSNATLFRDYYTQVYRVQHPHPLRKEGTANINKRRKMSEMETNPDEV
jgi:hypothetical protein